MELADMTEAIQELFDSQLASWPLARDNYAALARVQVKTLDVDGATYKVQFNPARIVSTGAKVDAKSISERKCFLCAANRPKEQRSLPFKERYDILVNPFPIFPRHLTIADRRHVPQAIAGRFRDMLDLAEALPDYTVFYNGAQCGASAPDHFHFQAGCRGLLPVENLWGIESLAHWHIGTLAHCRVYRSSSKENLLHDLNRICKEGEAEPMMNVLAMYSPSLRERGQGGEALWTVIVFPRKQQRPSCYYAEGDARLMVSPASVELGGLFITPREEDFRKITAQDVKQILCEVCQPMNQE